MISFSPSFLPFEPSAIRKPPPPEGGEMGKEEGACEKPSSAEISVKAIEPNDFLLSSSLRFSLFHFAFRREERKRPAADKSKSRVCFEENTQQSVAAI